MDDLLLKAISYSLRKHQGQLRKDGRTPYAAHPLRVMTILAFDFGVKDPELLATAVLHDTIEDTTADRDDLEQFGRRVARWVAALSKDKRLPEERREFRYFKRLAKAPVDVKLCKLADTLDNLVDSRSLPADQRRKTVAKAKEILKLFSPGFPKEWAHALDLVKEGIRSQES